MAALSGVSAAAVKVVATAAISSDHRVVSFRRLQNPWRLTAGARGRMRVVAGASPDKLSGKVEESIKKAEETCAENPVSGECAAAWDEVEELSAAAKHARDKSKVSDPLENFCKDNPERGECRTYDN